MAVFRYRDAGRKIGLYRDTLVPKVEQSLKVARQAFEAGEAEFLSLIDAERMLLEFELLHEQARTQRARQLALIEKLVGMPADTISRPEPAPEEEAE
jgi:outer membrane protein TolC